jgi:putative transposase
MTKSTKKLEVVGSQGSYLGELIHAAVRKAIEAAVELELEEALGAGSYERQEGRKGYRHGSKTRTLTAHTGATELDVPRGRMVGPNGKEHEWQSMLVPRYARRLPEINEAVVGVYLSGGNTRRIRGALAPLLKNAPLSKSAVSRVLATLKEQWEEWKKASLRNLDVAYIFFDGIALPIRSGGKVARLPVLAAMGVMSDGSKRLLALEFCSSESSESWKAFIDGLISRGLRAPKLCVIDGNAGLHNAISLAWQRCKIQRCTVHKLRNITAKVPKHAQTEVADDYHKIVYAKTKTTALEAAKSFVKKWKARCPNAVASLQEAGDDLLTFFDFPAEQWKSIRSTNTIERLNEEFRRRVKTQASLPNENAAVILLFSLIASGQITLRKIDGFNKLPDVLENDLAAAA